MMSGEEGAGKGYRMGGKVSGGKMMSVEGMKEEGR